MKKYSLENIKEPQLYEEFFRYDRIPKVAFDSTAAKPCLAEDFWITCTTFRDGQQARPPYTVKQIVDLYTYMHKLGGKNGVIRQCEFFLYSDKDKQAVEACRKLGFKYPEITGWIRAKKEDFKLVKEMNLKETGILTSASDYHIFLKLGLNRKKAMESYLGVVKAALDEGIIPRCHLEDITRADFYGFAIPFVQELMKLSQSYKIPVKVRACDTLGYGVPFSDAALPRGVPKLIRGLIDEGGVPPQQLEWHGHNDFHKVLVNALSAWRYGCSAANGTLLGFGERTGNPPIEALIIDYISLKGDFNGIDTKVITDIKKYFSSEIKADISPNYPFVGDDFNVTRAGIHADGSIKNERIYNIFDTEKLLKRPIGVSITDKSGTAGIAYWVNSFFKLKGKRAVSKHDSGVKKVYEWVMLEYQNHRVTSISNEEMVEVTKKYLPNLFLSELDLLKAKVKDLAFNLISDLVEDSKILSMKPYRQERALREVIDGNPFIELIYVADTKGNKITKNIAQKDYIKHYQKKLKEYGNFSDRAWFKGALRHKKVYFSDPYPSKVIDLLCVTVSAPILTKRGKVLGVLGIDIKFDDLVKT